MKIIPEHWGSIKKFKDENDSHCLVFLFCLFSFYTTIMYILLEMESPDKEVVQMDLGPYQDGNDCDANNQMDINTLRRRLIIIYDDKNVLTWEPQGPLMLVILLYKNLEDNVNMNNFL